LTYFQQRAPICNKCVFLKSLNYINTWFINFNFQVSTLWLSLLWVCSILISGKAVLSLSGVSAPLWYHMSTIVQILCYSLVIRISIWLSKTPFLAPPSYQNLNFRWTHYYLDKGLYFSNFPESWKTSEHVDVSGLLCTHPSILTLSENWIWLW
jgi:hypothetical protein